jgi:hypothetical protein
MIDTSELFVLAATIGSDPTDVGSLTFLFVLNTLAADRYPGTNFTGTGPDLGDTFEYSTPICTTQVQSDAQTNTKASRVRRLPSSSTRLSALWVVQKKQATG